MKRNHKDYPSVQFGTSLMLVVFMVLCLSAFAVLSLSSSLKNYGYSKKAAQKTTDYYKADAAASSKLSEISDILTDAYLSNPASYPESALKSLDKVEDITVTEAKEGSYPLVSYEEPAGDSQAIHVSLLLNGDRPSEERLFRIVQWKEISTQEWESNTTLPVIGSD